MTATGWLQAVVFFAIVLAVTKPLGAYMARVFGGERTFLSPVVTPVERFVYRVCGIDPASEMSASGYLFATLAFSVVGLFYLYALLRTQAFLPLNPQHFANLAPDLAWNTAVS